MTLKNQEDIHKLEKYNFCRFSGMNPQSNYCAVIPDIQIYGIEQRDINEIRKKDIEDKLKYYIAFVIYLPNKHVLAGLPPDSIIGSFFRRLIILLDYFKNVDSIIIFYPNKSRIPNPTDNKNLRILNMIYNLLIEFAKWSDQTIEEKIDLLYKQISLEKIIKRGRINRYKGKNFDTENKVKEILDRIKKIIPTYDVTENLQRHLDEVVSEFRLGNPYNDQLSFKVHPNVKRKKMTGLDVYNLRDNNVKSLYEKLEYLLYYNGTICNDQSGFCRIQMPFKTRCWLIYKNGESKIKEAEVFLDELGIDPIPFEKTRFYNNIKDIFEDYVAIVCDSIAKDKLGITNILPLVQKTSKELDVNRVQLGWIYSHIYLKRIDDKRIELSVLNDLRSIDLHDGFPYNLYYCIELAENLTKRINDRLYNLDINKKIILKDVCFDILSLHTYADNLPEKSK